jgi:hypothetical protein
MDRAPEAPARGEAPARQKAVAIMNLALPRVMPLKKAAAASGFAYTTLRDAHFRGELAIIRIGRAWYVDLSELARFVEHHTERKAG